MGKPIPDEVIKEIQKLKKEGKNKNQIQKRLNISWNTVEKYWTDEQKISLEERNRKRRLNALSREDYKNIYRYFNENISVVDVIEITGIREAREIFEEYCKDKQLPSPRDIVNYFANCRDSYIDMKKKMKELPGFEKRLDEMEEKVKRLYEHFKLDMGYNHDDDRPIDSRNDKKPGTYP